MNRKDVVFFTGAGISAESGIPTFQTQDEIRAKLTRAFANERYIDYAETIKDMADICNNAEPNAAHLSIAMHNFQVITMNVDRLHSRAGSMDVIELHGTIPQTTDTIEDLINSNIVLYGDIAPEYNKAIKLVKNMPYDKGYFVIVGTSFYTEISNVLLKIAKQRHAKIIIINDNASTRVPDICKYLMTQII